MHKWCIVSVIIGLIVGGLIGAGITYQQTKCKTSGMHIQFDSSTQNGPGITITKTEENKDKN